MEAPRCAGSRSFVNVSRLFSKLTLAAGTLLAERRGASRRATREHACSHRKQKKKHLNTSFTALIKDGERLIFFSHGRICSHNQ